MSLVSLFSNIWRKHFVRVQSLRCSQLFLNACFLVRLTRMQMMKSNSQHPIQLSKKLQNVYTAVANLLLIRKFTKPMCRAAMAC